MTQQPMSDDEKRELQEMLDRVYRVAGMPKPDTIDDTNKPAKSE
ncbi:MAG: hypothetical protein ACRBBW_20880 [Cellvibrionaceae bacterium]